MERDLFSNRLLYAMRLRGMRQVDILSRAQPLCLRFDVKLSKGTLSEYLNGKSEPSQAKLYILASVLNVSEAWLMGFDVSMDRSDPVVFDTAEPTNNWKRLEDLASKMTETAMDAWGELFCAQIENYASPTNKNLMLSLMEGMSKPQLIEAIKAATAKLEEM